MKRIRFHAKGRPLSKQLTTSVNTYFERHGISKHANDALVRKAIIVLSAFVLTYVGLLNSDGAWNIAWWVAHGLASALVGFNVMHDGAHSSLSSSPRINALAAATFNIIGSNRYYWNQKHNRNHHSFTNVKDVDEDIDTFGLMRLSPHQPRYAWHRFQHVYAWMLYPLTSLFWFFVLDFKAYASHKIGNLDFTAPMTWKDHLEFWGFKLLYWALYLALPISLLGVDTALWGFLLMHFVMGFLFAVVFQLAHVVDLAEFIQPNEEQQLDSEWAIHQLDTTVDFATDSAFVSWCLGGLNFQVEHHLFPRISHIHYPTLHRLIREHCEHAGHPVRSYPTSWQAIQGHYRHLRTLGQPHPTTTQHATL